MVKVLLFTEHAFIGSVDLPTLEAAQAFAAGFVRGGACYGAGSLGAYVMPDDEAEMREREHASEIERALKFERTLNS